MNTKKLLSLVLALAMALSVAASLSVTVFAEDEFVTVTTGSVWTKADYISLSGTCGDTNGVFVDGEETDWNDETGLWSFTLDTSEYDDGVHTIDVTTNVGTVSATYTLKRDTTVPNIYITQIYDTVIVTASDDVSGIETSGINGVFYSFTGTYWSEYSLPVILDSSATSFYVKAIDNAGNEASMYYDLNERGSATLDLSSDGAEILQKYNLTETEGDKEDVTKVKVSWEITDINVTRTDEMVWDTATLKWVSSDAAYTVVNDGQAVFTLENYSTVKIDATASFVAEAGFNPTVTFDDETGTDGMITLDTANGDDTYDKNNVPSAEITVTVTPSDGDFEGKDAAQGETYGTYTVTIAEHEEDEDTCFAAGTKITMADGTLKNIEDVRENDYVLTFNHEKGVYENQRVYLAYQGEYKKAAFTLGFANGATLSVVGVHDLFELETLCYVTLTEDNAAQFVGKHFYSVNDGAYVALTSVTYEKTPTAFYSVYTAYSANCVANGFLSVPDDDDERLNIYDFNEDLTVDLEQLANDVAAFGLYEYTGCTSASEDLFDELAWKYINVMIGKGLGTMEDFVARRDAFLGE